MTRKFKLDTVWRAWLSGKPEGQEYYTVDGRLTVVIAGHTQVGSLVDYRERDIVVMPKDIIDGKLHVLIDGKLFLMREGQIHDLHMSYETVGPNGRATIDATWHLRLVSAGKVKA